jgi:hypothetical protein
MAMRYEEWSSALHSKAGDHEEHAADGDAAPSQPESGTP